MVRRIGLSVTIAVILACTPSMADEAERVDAPTAPIADVEEHLGALVPPDIALRDESGTNITTGDLLRSDKPVVLVLAYFRCPMLCPLVLNGVSKGLQDAGLVLGTDYRLVTVSIDPEDTPVEAMKRKDALSAKVGAPLGTGARFVVGSAEATRAVADAVGFRYGYDSSTAQYSHPAVVTVLAAGGRISRYLYGIEPSARDLRFALVEAADGKIGSIVDRVLVTCYRFDPATRRYGPYITGFFRIGSLLILIVVGTFLGVLWRLERRRDGGRDRA
jgi:protein SCO1